MTRFPTSFQTA